MFFKQFNYLTTQSPRTPRLTPSVTSMRLKLPRQTSFYFSVGSWKIVSIRDRPRSPLWQAPCQDDCTFLLPCVYRSESIQWGYSFTITGHQGTKRTLSLQPTHTREHLTSICSSPSLVAHRVGFLHQPAGIGQQNTVLTIADRFSKAAHLVALIQLPPTDER